jgi:hypothetical protein
MSRKIWTERGQVLILVAFGIVGIFAIVALAIDGGNGYMNRRHAQNAADSAVLSAALAKVNNQDWHLAGMTRASENDFNNDGTTNTVTVNNPPNASDCNPNDAVSPYLGDDEYLQVIVRSTVDTYFGSIIGINETKICVEAIARGKTAIYVPLYFGSAMASTSCTAAPGIEARGSSNVTLIGGGAFSNSGASPSLFIQKLNNLITPGNKGVMAVGSIAVPNGYPSPVTAGATQIPCPLPAEMIPAYTCNYNDASLPGSYPKDANGVYILPPGVHCVSGSFSKADIYGNGITIVMLNEGIHWNGNAAMTLIAPSSGTTRGLVLYLPPSNHNQIRLNGTFDMVTRGSVFAPSSTCILQGDLGAHTMHSQWICNNFDLTGNVTASIQYDSGENYQFPQPPIIEIVK